jgi:hypothetical protein
MILATLYKNVELAKQIIRTSITDTTASADCRCQHALDHAIVTAPAAIPEAKRRQLALLLGRHLPSAKRTN